MRLGTALALSFLLASTNGCFYLEAVGGGHVAQGGVEGPGWNAGMAVGTYYDIGAVRVSSGGGGELMSTYADDGQLYTLAGDLNARADVLLSGGDGARMAGTFSAAYGGGNLTFTPPDSEKHYKGTTRVVSGFAGLGLNSGLVSFTLGPRILHASNRFVGDTTTFAGEARLTAWIDLTGIPIDPTPLPPAEGGGGGGGGGGSAPIQANPSNYDYHRQQQQEDIRRERKREGKWN